MTVSVFQYLGSLTLSSFFALFGGRNKGLFFALPVLLLAVFATLPTRAQESPQATDTSEQKESPFVVPEGKSVDELLEYAEKAIRENPMSANLAQKEAIEEVVKRSNFLLATADACLAKEPSAERLPQVLLLKFEALEHLARTNDADRVKQLEDFLEEFDRRLPNSRESKLARVIDLERRTSLFIHLKRSEEEFNRLKKLIFDLIRREPINYPPALPLNLVELSEIAEEVLMKKGLADKANKELLELLGASEDPGLRGMVEAVEAAAHVTGRPFTLKGTTLDEEEFDMTTLRGKVVLVDFFTSWCIPCIQEIPRLKRLAEQYKDKGFVIVGVGIDEAAKVRKIVEDHSVPWTVVSEELTVKNKMRSIARWYNITRYPTLFLIDREGRLIDAEARGPEFEKKLDKLMKSNLPADQ